MRRRLMSVTKRWGYGAGSGLVGMNRRFNHRERDHHRTSRLTVDRGAPYLPAGPPVVTASHPVCRELS
jgi:hypothetical protein